jgi:RNA polymerase sigma-70 factor (ECF subfamily)
VKCDSEEQWITAATEGDPWAFDRLVELHQDRIFNLCYWQLGNREDAADAAQDTFVRAYRSLKKFRGESTFATWLHRIAVNVCFDLRHKKRKAPLAYADLRNEEETPLLDSGTSLHDNPEQLSLRRERRQAVRHALAALPEHYRIALVLFEIEGYSYETISDILKAPTGTVKSRINRARTALAAELGRQEELFSSA